jgi:hypothetical protein
MRLAASTSLASGATVSTARVMASCASIERLLANMADELRQVGRRRVDVYQTAKLFFFEKKAPKNFCKWSPQWIKISCLFFSKKNGFLTYTYLQSPHNAPACAPPPPAT